MHASIATFEFFIALATVARSLFYLRGSTKKIQGRSLSLLDAVGQVEVPHEDLAFNQNDGAKESFPHCYSAEMANLIDIVPSMPQIAAQQQH